MFLRHEGFLGALGAFMSYEKHGLDDLMVHQLVERFPMGAPYTGGKIHGPPLGDLNEKASDRNSKFLICAGCLVEIIGYNLQKVIIFKCFCLSHSWKSLFNKNVFFMGHQFHYHQEGPTLLCQSFLRKLQ